MNFSYRSIAMLLSVIMFASLLKLVFFAVPKQNSAPVLNPQEIRQDLFTLLAQIEQRSAFYALRPDKVGPHINHMASIIAEQYQYVTPNDRFAAEVTKLLNTLKDPGALVHEFDDQSGDLPLTLRPLNDQWLALDNSNNPINKDFPFLTHIDGLPMSKWVAASQAYLTEPAKQSQEMQLSWLKKLNLLREDLGLSIKPSVLITLINDDLQILQVTLALPSPEPQAHFTPQNNTQNMSVFELINPRPQFELSAFQDVPNQLMRVSTTTAKLKISDLYAFELDENLQQELLQGMTQPLLIIDLRAASGFSPTLLTLLSRYQDAQRDNSVAPNVMGFSLYRRAPELRNDYLQPLNFRPLSELEYSQPKQKYLTRHLPTVDKNKFSPWYVRTKPAVAPDGKNHLVLLISPHCRQECEWIAYRTKSWSRVSLVGETTSGDFARQYHFTLPNSGLNVRFSSSLAYDLKGKILSGVGTKPDIWLPQNSDIQWQGLVSLVRLAKPKAQLAIPLQPTKLAQAKLN
ncbi:MAG: S41 family peptidase [Shewanella sp.]